MKFDLHVHTTLSACSRLRMEEILTHSRSLGLDGVCITDHDTIDITKKYKEGLQPDGLCVIFGMEYATPQGDFLIFGPIEDIPPNLSGPQLLAYMHSCQGAVIGAHPFRPGRSISSELLFPSLCPTIETINGRNPEHANTMAAQLASTRNMQCTGGSDAHTLDELARMTTVFPDPISCRADFVQAVRTGNFFPYVNKNRYLNQFGTQLSYA